MIHLIRAVFLSFLLTAFTSAQSYKFGWISDMHIGAPGAAEDLSNVVNSINNIKDIKFVIASGDISEKGRNEELQNAKDILDGLSAPYYIIPGNHDTKWSESGCTKFPQLWGEDKFLFEFKDHIYIGLNTGIHWRGGGGHIRPEDLFWLEEQLLQAGRTKEIYLIVHHPLNSDVDNWFKVTNLIRDYNIKAILHGHGHNNKIDNFNGIPSVMSRSTLIKGKKSEGFTLVENSKDRLFFYEVESDNIPDKWGEISKTKQKNIPIIDSISFNSFSTNLLWNLNLESTLSAEPLVWDNFIFTADVNGIVSCFDQNGSVVWNYNTFGNIMSKPAAMDGYLAVATVQGDLFTFDAYTGEQLQTIGFDEAITSQLIMIEYKGSDRLIIPKATDSKAAVILGTAGGRLYCFDIETLQEYWVNEKASAMIETQPLYINNKIIYGSWDTNVYCIDARTGLLIWTWSETNNFYYSPAVCRPVTDGKKLYITSPEKFVYAVDLNLGKTLWEKNNYNAWESIGISADGRLLFIKSMLDRFHIVSAVTTNWVRDMNLKFGIDTMPVTPIEYGKNILFGSKNGNIYKIDRVNFSFETILFLGASRAHSVQMINDNIFLASNMDGSLAVFTLK